MHKSFLQRVTNRFADYKFVCLQNGSKKKKQSPQIIDFVGFVIRWLSDVSEALRCVR